MDPPIDYDKIADLYDSYVRFEEDIPFFLEEARRAGGPVLELMSGTGRVSIRLVEAGEERDLPVRFVLLEAEDFESSSREAGFEIGTVYGDYDRSAFDRETSPYMIILSRRSAEVE